MASKRSKHELKRIIEDAVATVCGLPRPGLWFVIDEVLDYGKPPSRLRIQYTLHFFDRGWPFCCGEPLCHLGSFKERTAEIGNRVRLAMGLRQPVNVTFLENVRYCSGVTFVEPDCIELAVRLDRGRMPSRPTLAYTTTDSRR